MAVILKIEVANLLTEGYGAGGRSTTDVWNPLYRGVTMNLWGQSTAIQINNGDGKSTITQSSLYLLSRDKRLKDNVMSLCAPSDKGWTHVRIEFGEKSPGENLMQSDLITRNEDEFPGVKYVIGMCWNRDVSDPHFYRYQGELAEAPVYEKTENGLSLVSNSAFKSSIEKLDKRAQWNKWGRISDWHEEIRLFMDMAMVRQNVEFQLKGAGDASTMLKEIKPENGESFDEAFFRQAIAPELLKDTMGAEAGDKEIHFEDTLLRSLLSAANSTTDIARSQNQLDEAEKALKQFEPVLEKAQSIIRANEEYEHELNVVVKDAAILHLLAERHPVPGMPQIPSSPVWKNEKRLLQALGHLVIDKRHGILISDDGLAELIGVATGKLNEATSEKKIAKFIGATQVIDFKGDIKNILGKIASENVTANDLQPIDFKGDIKNIDARGGRRKEVSYYSLHYAVFTVSALAHYQDANVNGLEDLLKRAFSIAEHEIDTNSYRLAHNKLAIKLVDVDRTHEIAMENVNTWQDKLDSLLSADREAKDDQVAFEGFSSRKHEFLQAYWDKPAEAKKWAANEAGAAQVKLEEHSEMTGTLKPGFDQWNALTKKYEPISLEKALTNLVDNHETISATKQTAQKLLDEAKAKQKNITEEYQKKSASLTSLNKSKDELDRLRISLPIFSELFGNSDPDTLDPRAELKNNGKHREEKKISLHDASNKKLILTSHLPLVEQFHSVFGDADPLQLNPTQIEQQHRNTMNVEESNIAILQEGVESLMLFRERNPSISPLDWLNQTEKLRIELHGEKERNNSSISGWRADLLNFDKYALADSRVFSDALSVLDESNISYNRLHAVIMKYSDGERRTSLLTIFSSMLSAPVLSIEDAPLATEMLEKWLVTVPVFIENTLIEFIRSGEILKFGELSHTFFAGRRTRQVDVLLNPNLIQEEKNQIESNINGYLVRCMEIDAKLKEIAESSDLVSEAIKARDALTRNSEGKLKESQATFDRLNIALKDIQKRASKESLLAISAVIDFNRNGGTNALNELTQKIIPQLERDIKNIDEAISALDKQSTGDALHALDNIKKYKALGGEEKYSQLMCDIGSLAPTVDILRETLDSIRENIELELDGNLADANERLSKLLESYSHEKIELEKSIDFESNDYHTIMFKAEEIKLALQKCLSDALKRLQDIDFERAARYIDNKNVDRTVSERIAEAKSKKIEFSKTAEETKVLRTDIQGRMVHLNEFVEKLHEMAFELKDKATRLSGFSDDIRVRMHNQMGSHPDLQKYGEDIRFACMGEMPGTSNEILIAIANLRSGIESLELDTKSLKNLKKNQEAARHEFAEKRSEFCARARNKEITGLHELEIMQIESANTIDELSGINKLRELINKTIEERKGGLQKTKDLMHASKEASINNMTHFARIAVRNIELLDRVMKKSPRARFFIEAQVADEAHIRIVVESLLADIEDRERVARERSNAPNNSDIERRERGYRTIVKEAVYKEIFINPKVDFSHAGIWHGDRKPFNDILSMGQKTALHLMWLIKQAEFSMLRTANQFGTKKERDAALKNSQHILFFDGLFSNLSNEKIINEAFEGLKYVGDAFQLIGLIHNTRYVNNIDIFPAHLIGRRYQKAGDDNGGTRGFVTIEPWQKPGDMGMFNSVFKKKNVDRPAI